ncbi:MAG TPA: hypothetical protein VF601_15190 [Beijerinckiaceae bacterium]|jgi:hypothetical protein
MALEHEYALLGGVNRAKVGRYLALVSAAVSAVAVLISSGLSAWLEGRGLPREWTGWIASAVSAGVSWTCLYWLLDNYAWRWPPIGRALGVPDLSGNWKVKGQSLKADKSLGFTWEGTLTVIQKWDKLRVRLATSQSASVSITAAILCESGVGWRLFYTYRNEPKIGEPELQPHRGSADILFTPDRKTGSGEYFNGLGRFTFGTMELTKEAR